MQALAKAIVGGGCFWCIEAPLQRLKGVYKVQSGYTGGTVVNPTYQDVCSGKSNHAEVCRVHYDPKVIDYATLMYIFFHIHDPTTLNRQGYDTGTQYRSCIFYEKGNEKEHQTIKEVIKKVAQEGNYPGAPNKIVTEVRELDVFYKAEEMHQNYYNQNPTQGYCVNIIRPKLNKFMHLFKDKIDPSRASKDCSLL